MKINRIDKNLTVVLSDGTLLSNSNCDDTLYNKIIENSHNEDTIKSILTPKLEEIKKEIVEKTATFKTFEKSKILKVFGNSIYIEQISQLTLPFDLAFAIFQAEQAGNQELVTTYCNFWTLCCLNPDSRARTNLFWFLNRYGMTISKSGLFIAYRNVRVKKEGSKIDSIKTRAISDAYTKIKFKHKKSPKKYLLIFANNEYKAIDREKFKTSKIKKGTYQNLGQLDKLYQSLSNKEEATVYTDNHTRKMKIVIGQPVTLPRERCDAKQENTCSSGLHVAGKEWLGTSSDFGNVSVLCLVNPTDVVAVPPSDNYGKMRTCCYFPVKIIANAEDLQNTVEEYPNGFEDDFMNIIAYDGKMNEEQSFEYTLDIPEIPEISRSKVLINLKRISRSLKKVID